MWQRSENDSLNKPLEVEKSGSSMIVRKDFKKIDGTEEIHAHWAYLEWQMTKEQYDVYKTMNEKLSEQEDAILELADLIGGMM